jgi:hypothetical protein
MANTSLTSVGREADSLNHGNRLLIDTLRSLSYTRTDAGSRMCVAGRPLS